MSEGEERVCKISIDQISVFLTRILAEILDLLPVFNPQAELRDLKRILASFAFTESDIRVKFVGERFFYAVE